MKYTLVFLFSVCAFFAQAQKAKVQSDSTKSVVKSESVKTKGELIKPIKVWKAGQSVDAENIDLAIVYDDLVGSAKVYYSMKDSTGAQVADGNVDISGADYRQFNVAQNRINWTYNFVIRALRLQQRNQIVN